MPNLPDRLGDYRIGDLIGVGGMGHVFEGVHVRMDRRVAIKVIDASTIPHKKWVDRFYQEIRSAARVMHPNIVTALDAGQEGDLHYLVMEFVDGGTLSQTVRSTGPLSVAAAASVVRQAAMGLLHAHRMGLVHRDVKPGNLMRAADGTVKVLDLGLAQIFAGFDAAPGDQPRAIVGTLPYMSPEQLEGAATVDYRSDIYSLGATLHFLLTGYSPYSGPYIDQVYGHRHGPVPDLMESRDDVDMTFQDVFARMMAKDPDHRFASLDEVAEELQPYADSSEIPRWLAELGQRVGDQESSVLTNRAGGAVAAVAGLDLGMSQLALARCEPDGRTMPQRMNDDGVGGPMPAMIASDPSGVLIGRRASDRRRREPASVLHCLPLYIGREKLPRRVVDRDIPPEAAIGLMIRHLVAGAWDAAEGPASLAVTVPASYDQLHRRSVLHAASIAGFGSVRLVDRSLAAAAWVEHDAGDGDDPGDPHGSGVTPIVGPMPTLDGETDSDGDGPTFTRRYVLFVGISGQGVDAGVMRVKGNRIKQLANAGHWTGGSLGFQRRLIEAAAEGFYQRHGFDPRRHYDSAATFQMACERAMLSMTVLPRASISVGQHRVTVTRDQWLAKCDDLLEQVRQTVLAAERNSGRRFAEIDQIILFGNLTRTPEIRRAIVAPLPPTTTVTDIDRESLAAGAAICLASQLPGTSVDLPPPRSVAGQTIGLAVEDAQGRTRILPVIPAGTPLPARMNRRVNRNPRGSTLALTVVESTGPLSAQWQTLGRSGLPPEPGETPEKRKVSEAVEGGKTAKTPDEQSPETDSEPSADVGRSAKVRRSVSLDLDINGLLTMRVQRADAPGSVRLPPLPTPTLDDAGLDLWRRWVESKVGD